MNYKTNSDLDKQIEALYQCQKLSQDELISLCERAVQILRQEKNVVRIHGPVVICGDIHGQFSQLIQIFNITGKIPLTNYLFLGDYVNRGYFYFHSGYFSVETLSLLLALKIRYKDRITLLRGNHDASRITQTYQFYDECNKKYGTSRAWKAFTQVFDYLPLAAVVQNQLFCVHAGLSFKIETIDDIEKVNRAKEMENPLGGIMTDLVWTRVDQTGDNWSLSPKGADYFYGKKVTEQFNHRNNIKMIVRAHELQMEGYKTVHDGRVTTVFSAANYCYRCVNLGAVIDIDQHGKMDFFTFEAAHRKQKEIIKKRFPDYFI